MSEKNLNILIKTLNEINFDNNENELLIKEDITSLFKSALKDLDFHNIYDSHKNKLNTLNENLNNELNTYKTNILRSFKVADNKNNTELENYKLELENKNDTEYKKYVDRKNSIDKKIQSKSKQYNDATLSHLKSFDEEIVIINKEIDELKELTRIEQNKIEVEINDELKELEKNYLEKTAVLKEELKNNQEKYSLKINEILSRLEVENKEKDESYLTIKKTHLNSSIKFNEFINEIKTKYQQLEDDLIKEHNNTLNDIKIEIEDLDDYFEHAKKLVLHEYTEKLKALNVVFDVQKSVHNKQNNQIILEHNKEVTTINNRLSINKNNLNEQIKKFEQEKIDEKNKVTLTSDKDRINIHYNKLIKKINKNIMREIKKTNDLLYSEEKSFQSKLFNHDYKNLKHLNEWRYQKLIYDKEREVNYNIALSKIENDKFILEQNSIYQINLKNINLEILKLKLVRELLPIESQLHLSSILQSRDINLLNIEYDSFKLENNLNVTILKKEEELINYKLYFQLESFETKYNYEKRMIELRKQLSVEREIVKRDYEIKKLDLNKDLQKYLLDQRNKRFSNSIDNEIKSENIKLKSFFEQYHYFKNKNQILLETLTHKKDLTINEIISRNHKLTNSKLTTTNITIMDNEVTFNDQINIIIIDQIFEELNILKSLNKHLLGLIDAPSHPEVIRAYLKILEQFSNSYQSHFEHLIDHLSKFNFNSIETSLKEILNNKYENRKNELISINDDNTKVIENAKKILNSNINSLLDKTRELEKQLEANILLLNNFKQLTSDKYAINQTKFLEAENKKLSIDIRNNKNTIKSLFKQRKPLDQRLKRNEVLLQNNIKKLDLENIYEVRKVNLLKSKLNKSFINIIKTNTSFITSLSTIHDNFSKNLYLLDSKVNSFIKRIKNIFKNYNNKLLLNFNEIRSFWLNLYNYYERKENKYNEKFLDITNNYLKLIEDNYNTFDQNKNKELLVLDKNFNNINKMLDGQRDQINELKKESHQSINDLYNKKYLEIVKEIENLDKISNNKQSIVSTNLDEAINTNKNKLNNIIIKLNAQNRRNQLKIEKDIKNLQFDIKDNINKTNMKANIFTSRFDKERKYHLNEIKNKRNKFNYDINIKFESINEHIVNKTKIINKYKVLTKERIKNYGHEFNNYKTITKKDQRKLLQKERKDLTLNYKFKAKETKYQLKKKV